MNTTKKLAKILPFVSFFTIWVFFFSCTEKSSPDVSQIQVNVDIQRLDQELVSCRNIQDVQGFLTKNEYFTKSFYQTTSQNQELATSLFALISNIGFQKFYQETYQEMGDLADIRQELEQAFKHIKYHYPDFKEPKVATIVTGLTNDLYVSDSLVVICLDAFAGPKASYRPEQPQYILRRYQKEYIVPMIVQYLSGKYNLNNPKDGTLLADMVYYGKALAFTKAMMPQKADSLLIGYTQEQLDNTYEAQDLVWAHFIDQKLLYETKPPIKDRYIGERPSTPEIGPKCPGAIGYWLGWRIVDKYLAESEDIDIKKLMQNKNVQEILTRSKYRGLKEHD